jgi:adenylate cyclase
MSLHELAAMVRQVPAPIDELSRAGLLDPAGEGQFDDLDLLRLMAIRHYEALGYDVQRLAQGIATGEIEPFLGEYIYPREAQITVDEAAERSGTDPDMLSELLIALGWSRSGFLPGDLRMLEGFNAVAASGMPREALLEGARVFGDTLRRLAETLVRLVHVHIHERLLEEGLTEEDVIRRIHGLQEAAFPIVDAITERVLHEHFIQADIEDAYVHLVDTDTGAGRGSVDTTIVFIDVESFTQLTETKGDQAAIDTMTRVDSLVRSLLRDHDGKVVKHLGDALMLAFRQPPDAVGFAGALHEATASGPSLPGLRVGIHFGPAIYRAGDYLGNTVNVASRVTTTATAGQTVLTDAVAQRLGDSSPIEPIGVRMLRGAARPVRLYRLISREERRDPTCGRTVAEPPAARLRHGDEELWFCSEQCLRDFLTTTSATATAGSAGTRARH